MTVSVRKLMIGVVGFTLFLAGAVLFVLPTPVGWIIVPASLIILSTEYSFARRWLTFLERRTGWFGRKLRRAESGARAYASRVLQRMPWRRSERDVTQRHGSTGVKVAVDDGAANIIINPQDTEDVNDRLPVVRLDLDAVHTSDVADAVGIAEEGTPFVRPDSPSGDPDRDRAA